MNGMRCKWVTDDPLYIAYHDHEWGVPCFDDQKLFEFILLEGAQAGLSWITVLKKRENYRAAFANFDPHQVATFGDKEFAEQLANTGLIRNRLKLAAAPINARGFLAIQAEFGSFSHYAWQFVGQKPIINHWPNGQIPARTEISDALSRDLQKRGFKFVGSTICYAWMQAMGLVNDHAIDCFRHAELL